MKHWAVYGILWGLFMYVVMTFIVPLIRAEEITTRQILTAIPIWLIGGLIFGYINKLIKDREAGR